MISQKKRALLFTVLLSVASTCNAATLHGRVKDQRCSVLSQVHIQLRSVSTSQRVERTVATDESGNYNVDLPAGDYQLCVQRDAHTTPVCNGISVAAAGDMWITTQLRDTAPDLSSFGNRSY